MPWYEIRNMPFLLTSIERISLGVRITGNYCAESISNRGTVLVNFECYSSFLITKIKTGVQGQKV